jgi:hypothetical protein
VLSDVNVCVCAPSELILIPDVEEFDVNVCVCEPLEFIVIPVPELPVVSPTRSPVASPVGVPCVPLC